MSPDYPFMFDYLGGHLTLTAELLQRLKFGDDVEAMLVEAREQLLLQHQQESNTAVITFGSPVERDARMKQWHPDGVPAEWMYDGILIVVRSDLSSRTDIVRLMQNDHDLVRNLRFTAHATLP